VLVLVNTYVHDDVGPTRPEAMNEKIALLFFARAGDALDWGLWLWGFSLLSCTSGVYHLLNVNS
jgi:hypothetical protein